MAIDDIQALNAEQTPLAKLSPNTGQIQGVPRNPRLIRDHRFAALCKSLKDHPEMTALREIIAFPHNGRLVIIAGNMRFRAMKHLGTKQAPVKILPTSTPVTLLRAIAYIDNETYGDWDWDIIANECDLDELKDFGIELPNIEGAGDTEEGEQEGDTLPTPPAARIIFASEEQLAKFRKDMKQKIEETYPGARIA